MDPRTPRVDPDLTVAARFLTLLDEEAEGFSFQTFDDAKKGRQLARILYGPLDRHARELARLNAQGAGIFVMVNCGDGHGRSANNVTGIRALFADFDGTPLPTSWPIEPHILVQSSPGEHWHAYWMVYGVELGEFSELQERLAVRLHTDASVKDLPRVMRLPGFYHLKKEPFLTHIIAEALAQPYERAELVRAFELDKINGADMITTVTAQDDERLRETIRSGDPGVHEALMSLAARFAGRGMAPRDINAALRGLMDEAPWRTRDAERWRARYAEISRDVKTAVVKFGDKRAHPNGPERTSSEPDPEEFSEGLTPRVLMSTPAVPTTYCVEQRVPSGLVLIAGRPKSKKSWLALQICVGASRNGETLGAKARGGRALAILLEDNKIRTRKRLEFFGITTESAPDNLHLFYTWPTGDLGVAKLERWMQANPDTVLIIIDVLQRFRGARDPRQGAYEADYAMLGLLQRFASQHPGLTVLVVHHTKKGGSDDPVEAINGTFGITGAADAYIVLVRRQDQERWAVHIDGRDWEDWQHDFLWEFKQGTGWEWLGILDEDLTDRQAEIVAMAKDKPLTPSTLATAFGISKQAAGEALQTLVKKDVLYNQGGKYRPFLQNLTTPSVR